MEYNFSLQNNTTPVIFLENIFDDHEINLVYNELNFLTPHLKNPEDTGTAKDKHGVILKKNKGIFFTEVYTKPHYSIICDILSKKILDTNSKVGSIWEPKWVSNMWKNINIMSFLLSYYENDDHYFPHHDISVFTCLVWIWKEPKKFEGGDLMLGSPENIIYCKNNCGIIFPSGETHAVTPISLNDDGYGRYCITIFISVDFIN